MYIIHCLAYDAFFKMLTFVAAIKGFLVHSLNQYTSRFLPFVHFFFFFFNPRHNQMDILIEVHAIFLFFGTARSEVNFIRSRAPIRRPGGTLGQRSVSFSPSAVENTIQN